MALGIIVALVIANLALVRVVALLQRDSKAIHAKCIAHIADVVSNRVIALALRDEAKRWDSIEERTTLAVLAREEYKVGGPSMPAIWLCYRADQREGCGDDA